MNIPMRAEYPRPQFKRAAWQCLNGEWEFEYDDEGVGEEERWHHKSTAFTKKIQVPFTFQSKLSGIGDPAFHDVVWYRRNMEMPSDWAGKRVLLHFGAVDYEAKVWVNGQFAVAHEGGHTPFFADITNCLNLTGANEIVVRAEDYSRDLTLPRGKQYWREKSELIFYTRTTGIWQSVWMEAVDKTHIARVRLTPDIDANEILLQSFVQGLDSKADYRLQVNIDFKGTPVTEDVFQIRSDDESRSIHIHDYNDIGFGNWWTPENPNLYDIRFTLLRDGVPIDKVTSYFGMRKISVEQGKLCLNNRPYYMRLALDQGYFPDGILTPPSEDAIRQDVELTKNLGLNGVRKHQKVEDPLFLYWCDQLGLLVWGEMANAYNYSVKYAKRFAQEWQEVIERDYNHPCVVVWVPLNESWGVPNIQKDSQQQQHALAMYHLTKSMDSTRLVVSNDGWEHMATDLCTIHDYAWQESTLKERYQTVESAVSAMPVNRNLFVGDSSYQGEPILVSEFGGIAFKQSEWEGWGYTGAENEEQFLEKIQAVVHPLLTSPIVQGFCYTQLTDVEQEINGLLTYDRKLKAPLEKIRNIFTAFPRKHT